MPVNPEQLAAVLLIVVPVAFNGAFFALARAFDYPDILRREPDEILRRFAAGGPGLLLRWELLLLSALAMLPLAAVLAVVLAAPPALSALAVVLGVSAALVQALGLVRWPYGVSELARRYVAAPAGPRATRPARRWSSPSRRSTACWASAWGSTSATLLTGLWTLAVAASILVTPIIPAWMGFIGIPIGAAILVGVLEFAGPNEPDGWALAGAVVPIAYIAWSVWLIALGILMLI